MTDKTFSLEEVEAACVAAGVVDRRHLVLEQLSRPDVLAATCVVDVEAVNRVLALLDNPGFLSAGEIHHLRRDLVAARSAAKPPDAGRPNEKLSAIEKFARDNPRASSAQLLDVFFGGLTPPVEKCGQKILDCEGMFDRCALPKNHTGLCR